MDHGEVQLLIAAQQALSTVTMVQDFSKNPFPGDTMRVLSEQNGFHESMSDQKFPEVNNRLELMENLQQPIATELPSDQENRFSDSIRIRKRKRGSDALHPALSSGQRDGGISPSLCSSMVTVLKFKNGEFVEAPSTAPNYNSSMSLKDMRKAITSSLENCMMEPVIEPSRSKPSSQNNSPLTQSSSPKQNTSPKRMSPRPGATKEKTSPKPKESVSKTVTVQKPKAPTPAAATAQTLPPPGKQQQPLPQTATAPIKLVTTTKKSGLKPKKPKSPDAESIKFANRQRELQKLKKEMRQKIKIEGHDSELAKQALGDWARTVGVSCTMCGKHVQKSYGCFRRENAPERLKYLFTPGMNRIKICRRCLPYKKQGANAERPIKKGPKRGPGKKVGNEKVVGQGMMDREDQQASTNTLEATENEQTNPTEPQSPFSVPQVTHISLGTPNVPQGPQIPLNMPNVPQGSQMPFKTAPHVPQVPQMYINIPTQGPPQMPLNLPPEQMFFSIPCTSQGPQMSINNIQEIHDGSQLSLSTPNAPQGTPNIPQEGVFQPTSNATEYIKMLAGNLQLNFTNKDAGTMSNMAENSDQVQSPSNTQPLTPLTPEGALFTHFDSNTSNQTSNHNVPPLNVPLLLGNSQIRPNTVSIQATTGIKPQPGTTITTMLPPAVAGNTTNTTSPVTPDNDATTGSNATNTTMLSPPWTPVPFVVQQKQQSSPSLNQAPSLNKPPSMNHPPSLKKNLPPTNKVPSVSFPTTAPKLPPTAKQPTTTIQKLSALTTGNVTSIPAAIVVSSKDKKAGQVMLQIQPVKLVRQLPKDGKTTTANLSETNNAKPDTHTISSPVTAAENQAAVTCAGCNVIVTNPYSITKTISPAQLQHLFTNDCEVLRVCGKCLYDATVTQQRAVGMVTTPAEELGGDHLDTIKNQEGPLNYQDGTIVDEAGLFDGDKGTVKGHIVIAAAQDGSMRDCDGSEVSAGENVSQETSENDLVINTIVRDGTGSNADTFNDPNVTTSAPAGVEHGSESPVGDFENAGTVDDSMRFDGKDWDEIGLLGIQSGESVGTTEDTVVDSGSGRARGESCGNDGSQGMLMDGNDIGGHAVGEGTFGSKLESRGFHGTQGGMGYTGESADDVEIVAQRALFMPETVVLDKNYKISKENVQEIMSPSASLAPSGPQNTAEKEIIEEKTIAERTSQPSSQETTTNVKGKPSQSRRSRIVDKNAQKQSPNEESSNVDREKTPSAKVSPGKLPLAKVSLVKLPLAKESLGKSLLVKEFSVKSFPAKESSGQKAVPSPKQEVPKSTKVIIAKTHHTRGATLKILKEMKSAKEASLEGKRRAGRGKRARVEETGTDEVRPTTAEKGSPAKRTKNK